MHITATEAKNRFGSVCAQAKREPVFVEKAGLVDTVILSVEHYQALQTTHSRSTLAARKAAFEAEFGGWIQAQNELVESAGIPGSDLRPW
jgi:prevent-host-death family protein